MRYHLVFHGEVELGRRDLERAEPLDAGDPDPAREHQAQREAVVGQERLAVRPPTRGARRRGPCRPGTGGVRGRSRPPGRRSGSSRPVAWTETASEPQPDAREDVAEADAFPPDGADGAERPLGAGGRRPCWAAKKLRPLPVHSWTGRSPRPCRKRRRRSTTAPSLDPAPGRAGRRRRRAAGSPRRRSAASGCGYARTAAPGGSGSGRVDGVPAHLGVGAVVDEPVDVGSGLRIDGAPASACRASGPRWAAPAAARPATGSPSSERRRRVRCVIPTD